MPVNCMQTFFLNEEDGLCFLVLITTIGLGESIALTVHYTRDESELGAAIFRNVGLDLLYKTL